MFSSENNGDDVCLILGLMDMIDSASRPGSSLWFIATSKAIKPKMFPFTSDTMQRLTVTNCDYNTENMLLVRKWKWKHIALYIKNRYVEWLVYYILSTI